jgi:hypothetical protein
MAQATVVTQEGAEPHPSAVGPDNEVGDQGPGSGLEPDPVFAAFADLPSGHGQRRSSPAEPQTEQTAPDQQLGGAGDVAEHRPGPLLRCRAHVR